MIFECRLYDKAGKLKSVISKEELTKRFWDFQKEEAEKGKKKWKGSNFLFYKDEEYGEKAPPLRFSRNYYSE